MKVIKILSAGGHSYSCSCVELFVFFVLQIQSASESNRETYVTTRCTLQAMTKRISIFVFDFPAQSNLQVSVGCTKNLQQPLIQ